jgi:hypothetical protein
MKKEFPIVWNGEEFDELEEPHVGSSDAILITIDHNSQVSVSQDEKIVSVIKNGKEIVKIEFPNGRTKYRVYNLIHLLELAEAGVEKVRSYKKEEK